MPDEKKEIHAAFLRITDELRKGYDNLLAEAAAGNFNTTEYKARKKALAVKEREMKQMLAEARKAARAPKA